jgi:magnesium-transporting ATPase (P-type)
MSVKNSIAASLLFIGLVISIIGWNKKAPETVSQEVKGTEVVLNNSDSQHFNWRAFMGLTLCVVGVGLIILPDPKQLEAERYGR